MHDPGPVPYVALLACEVWSCFVSCPAGQCPGPVLCGALLAFMYSSCAVWSTAGHPSLVLCCVVYCWPDMRWSCAVWCPLAYMYWSCALWYPVCSACHGPVPCGTLQASMSLVLCHVMPYWPAKSGPVPCGALLTCVSRFGDVWGATTLHVLVLCCLVPCWSPCHWSCAI